MTNPTPPQAPLGSATKRLLAIAESLRSDLYNQILYEGNLTERNTRENSARAARSAFRFDDELKACRDLLLTDETALRSAAEKALAAWDAYNETDESQWAIEEAIADLRTALGTALGTALNSQPKTK